MVNRWKTWAAFNRTGSLTVLMLILFLPFSAVQSDDWRFKDVERIVAVSDIHGAYGALVETLRKAKVIDDHQAWSGGSTHLVITGDLLDRGPGSRMVMDLVMRLEKEARMAGGRVHQLLGNHEVMNLIGDLRYVAGEEYAAFSDTESVEERKLWYQRFRQRQPADIDESVTRAKFEEKAPSGYFGHRQAFGPAGLYGKWLLEKPIMIVINDTVFVHGGLPPYVAENGLEGVNRTLKNDLANYVASRAALTDAGMISPLDGFRELPRLLASLLESGKIEAGLEYAARAAIDLSKSPLNNSAGPTWYRGTAACSKFVEGDVLNAALAKLDASRVVIGHTPTGTRRVEKRMNGRVIMIDTGMLKSHYNGSGNALVITDGEIRSINQEGSADWSPVSYAAGERGFGPRLADDLALAGILRNGVVVDWNANGAPWNLVQVKKGDETVFAYFKMPMDGERYLPELAAYKLDRQLQFGMVPVTVLREIEGQMGTLQYVPTGAISERERVTGNHGDKVRCPLEKQRAVMHIFDALINNPSRTPSSMMYDPGEWKLMLVDHQNSFGEQNGPLSFLENGKIPIDGEWRTALAELHDNTLRELLQNELSERQLKVLFERRDQMIGRARP